MSLQLTHFSFNPCLFPVRGAEAAMCGLPAEQFLATCPHQEQEWAAFSHNCPAQNHVPTVHLSGSKIIRRFEVSHAPAERDRTTHLLLQPQWSTGNPELGSPSMTFSWEQGHPQYPGWMLAELSSQSLSEQSREHKHPNTGHHLPSQALNINPGRTFTPLSLSWKQIRNLISQDYCVKVALE